MQISSKPRLAGNIESRVQRCCYDIKRRTRSHVQLAVGGLCRYNKDRSKLMMALELLMGHSRFKGTISTPSRQWINEQSLISSHTRPGSLASNLHKIIAPCIKEKHHDGYVQTFSQDETGHGGRRRRFTTAQ